MASLGFEEYCSRFKRLLAAAGAEPPQADEIEVRRFYRWDEMPVARFKYLANFQVPAALRDQIMTTLFTEHFGDEQRFASTLHVSWDEAREMQSAGMVLGGHSHRHRPLPTMSDAEKRADIELCAALMHQRLDPQPCWPFSYPYGAVDDETAALVRAAQYSCGFTTATGTNEAGRARFRILRIDPKDLATAVPRT
jgi:hypothetical protein